MEPLSRWSANWMKQTTRPISNRCFVNLSPIRKIISMPKMRLMAESGFPATAEHRGEHVRVLSQMKQIDGRVQKGRIAMGRAYGRGAAGLVRPSPRDHGQRARSAFETEKCRGNGLVTQNSTRLLSVVAVDHGFVETEATVRSCGDGQVIVATQRRSSCGSCLATGRCGTEALGNLIGSQDGLIRLESGAPVRAGQTVVIGNA